MALRTSETGSAPYRDVFAFTFHISPSDRTKVIAIPRLDWSWLYTMETITGELSSEQPADGRRTYLLTCTCNSRTVAPSYFLVTLSADGTTLAGSQDASPALTSVGPKPQVTFKKGVTPESMLFYPSPSELTANKPAALWRFALSAVRDAVRRRRFSWDFLLERRARKHRLASLLYAASISAYADSTPLHPDDAAECTRLVGLCTPADLHFCAHVALVGWVQFPWLVGPCWSCGRVLKTESGSTCPGCGSGEEFKDAERANEIPETRSGGVRTWTCGLQPNGCVIS